MDDLQRLYQQLNISDHERCAEVQYEKPAGNNEGSSSVQAAHPRAKGSLIQMCMVHQEDMAGSEYAEIVSLKEAEIKTTHNEAYGF